MLVLLPPSETKRSGGDGAPLELDALALPTLAAQRTRVIDALVALSADAESAARVLKLGARRLHEIADNAVLRSARTLPAIDRYTGVLFDALDAASLDAASRAWLGEHVLIHSAPFGPVGALDGIPTYRLSGSTSVPGLGALRRIWADAVTAGLRQTAADFVLDLRSEAYVALGPVPDDLDGVYVRVVAEGPDGSARALNHFNKKAKGELTRKLALTGARIGSLSDLLTWAQNHRVCLRGLGPREVALVAPHP